MRAEVEYASFLLVKYHYLFSTMQKFDIECLHANKEFYFAMCFVLGLTFFATA